MTKYFNLELTEESHKKLKLLAATTGKSMRQIVVELIDLAVKGEVV